MRSRMLSLAAVLLLAGVLYKCKQDDDPAGTEESPFYDFFKESSIVIDTVIQSADSWEYGFVFTPLKTGKITHLGLKLPAKGDFTVTLWDLSGPTPVPVRSKTISSNSEHAEVVGAIPEITLQKDVKMAVTILSDAFYRITKSNGGTFSFPKTIGSIRVESFHEDVNNTALTTFPPDTSNVRVAPCVNVVFIAD